MPNMLRTATPMGVWQSFKFICEETAGWLGAKAAQAAAGSWYYVVQDSIIALIEDVAFGDEGVGIYEAEKIMAPKKNGASDVFLPGDIVWFDPSTRTFTGVADTAFYRAGIATEPAGRYDDFVEISLRGAGAVGEPGAF